jgi:hypothetical protein
VAQNEGGEIMDKIICGIDPGITGGICLMNQIGEIQQCVPMPVYFAGKSTEYDRDGIKANIILADVVYIEKSQSMPKMGSKAMFNYGMGYGTLLTILWSLKIPYQEVRPMTWRKVMLADMPKEKENKKGPSIKRAMQLAPGYDFRKSERCKKPHNGMVEAYLIARYGKMMEGYIK